MGINHITLIVNDKQMSEKFYTQALGLEKLNVGNSLWVKVGNQFLHISKGQNLNIEHPFKHFAIEVEDLQTYIQMLLTKNVELFYFDDVNKEIAINPDLIKNNSQCFTRDPDGNLIEFIEMGNAFFHPV
jgi:catechol 2,3-dioxygenase-like lactoylglutathione lyase family enzyme